MCEVGGWFISLDGVVGLYGGSVVVINGLLYDEVLIWFNVG